MVDRVAVGTSAARILAGVRLVNGALGLFAPRLLVERTGADPNSTEAFYAFRMFGVRTLVLGADLLMLGGADQRAARSRAVLIHGSDTACALLGGWRGDLPPRAAKTAVAISAANLALAITARVLAPPTV